MVVLDQLASRLSGAKVQVTVESGGIFVAPPLHALLPTNDPELRGSVLVSLSTAKRIKRVHVVLEGIAKLFSANGALAESSTTLHKELYLELGTNESGELLGPGDHAFSFAFVIPSTTDVYQRSKYGLIYHYVKATGKHAPSRIPSSEQPLDT